MTTEIDCLTWNVHRGRGRDGRIDTDRTVDSLLEMIGNATPDLLVLTEADAEQPPYGGILDLDRIARVTGMRHSQTARRLRWGADSHGFLGTLVFHGPRLSLTGGDVIDLPGHYPRGASFFSFATPEARFRLVATHLSLTQILRAVQLRAIGQYLNRSEEMASLLIGDLNEWRPWDGLAFSPRLLGHTFRGPSIRSFPAHRPVLPLDRVMATPPAVVRDARSINSPDLRTVSDHLPVRATVRLT